MRRKAKHMKKPSFPDHQNLAKGGVVKMAGGGELRGGNGTAAGDPTQLSGPTTSNVVGNAINPSSQGPLGAVNGFLGTNDNFQAGAAAIQNGTNTQQLNSAYGQTQGALNQQSMLANTLNPQAASAVSEQNALAQEYAQIAAGGGPNPALAQLNQTTGQNVANTTAEMAGQRGASSNVGLIARQAAQQGAATQQAAAGQAATNEAQQQIAAQNNLATLANNQANQSGQAQTNSTNAQIAEQANLQNANTSANNANVSQQSNINNVNAATASQNSQNNSNLLSDVTNGIASFFHAKGGEVQKMAEGGTMGAIAPVQVTATGISSPSPVNIPVIKDPGYFSSLGSGDDDDDDSDYGSNTFTDQNGRTLSTAAQTPGSSSFVGPVAPEAHGGRIAPINPHHFHMYFGGGKMAAGGTVKALVSPGEVYLSPDKVQKVLKEDADPMKIGHKFPGRDKVKGKDSYKNDVLPTELESGGVVIPVHITEHKESSQRGRKFVRNAMAKHMKKPEKRA